MPSLANLILCLATTAVSYVATASLLPDVLAKDVVIIGGGASGAYAAVRLRDDYDKSIALVETRDRLVSKQHTIHASPCTA